LLHWSIGLLLGCLDGAVTHLVEGVDKVAARSVGTEANTVVSFAKVCLILGVAVDIANLLVAMSKLTLLAILASAILLVGTTHLGLVAGSLLCRGGNWGTLGCLTLASIHEGST